MNLQRIQHLLEQAGKQRRLVIGDVMLDEFVWGKVSRISPEAPVPVVEVQSESSYPGGAANVARNLRPFCKSVQISGVVGCDSYATRLKMLLGEEGIATDGLIETPEMPTIVKTRIIARQQQVVRVDRERRVAVSASTLDAACARVAELLPGVDGVIFEDYGKGFLSQDFVDRVSDLAIPSHKIITADPNPGNPLHWKGITTLKPNRSEAFAMAGRRGGGRSPGRRASPGNRTIPARKVPHSLSPCHPRRARHHPLRPRPAALPHPHPRTGSLRRFRRRRHHHRAFHPGPLRRGHFAGSRRNRQSRRRRCRRQTGHRHAEFHGTDRKLPKPCLRAHGRRAARMTTLR